MPTLVPAQYQTSDGRLFDNQEEAERHERLVKAQHAYENARRKYSQALAETMTTADGVPFQASYCDYFYITHGFGGSMPELRTVEFTYWKIDYDAIDRARIVREDSDGKRTYYRVDNLYFHRKNAEAALLQARVQWLLDTIEDHKDVAQALGIGVVKEDDGRRSVVLNTKGEN